MFGVSTLVIDRSTAFDPEDFIGKGWSIPWQDDRSTKLSQIDFAKVRFWNCLRPGEVGITGEEKHRRLTIEPVIRLGADIAPSLMLVHGQAILRSIQAQGIIRLELAGSVLVSPHGNRCFLTFELRGADWHWDCDTLTLQRNMVSPLLDLPNYIPRY